MARTIAVVAQKKFGWTTKTSLAVFKKDPILDKKQKLIADQQKLQNGKSQYTDFPAESEDRDSNSRIESGDPKRKIEEEPESFLVDPHYPKQVLRIVSRLHPQEMTLIKKFLSNNLDVFAWAPTNMPGIDPSIICHKLSIKADAKTANQKPMRMNEKWSGAVSDEVDCLLQANFIRETFYLD